MHSMDDSAGWCLSLLYIFSAALINFFKLSSKVQVRSEGLNLLQAHCTLIMEWG